MSVVVIDGDSVFSLSCVGGGFVGGNDVGSQAGGVVGDKVSTVVGVGAVSPIRVVGGVANGSNDEDCEFVDGGDVGSPMWVDDDNGNAVAILDVEDACNNDDAVAILDFEDACVGVDIRIADDAGVVGMGRGSGARPRWLPILGLCCVVVS